MGWNAHYRFASVDYPSMNFNRDFVNLLAFLLGLFISASILLPGAAHAALAMIPQVSGYAKNAATGRYLNNSVGAGQALFDAAASTYGTTGSVNLPGGKSITVPAKVPLAAGAGSLVKDAIRLNPYALAASLALGYLAENGMTHDGQAWNKAGTLGDSTLNPGKTWKQPVGAAPCYQTGDWCTYPAAIAGFTGYFVPANGYPSAQIGSPVLLGSGDIQITVSQSGISNDYTLTVTGTSRGASHPATPDDWAGMPDPIFSVGPELPRAAYMPEGAPVGPPNYDFAPFSTPIGEPYTKPDGSTAQPMAKVSPNGQGITMDTYDDPLTNPDGTPATNKSPQDTPEPAPEHKTDCDKYPQSLGCANLDTPVQEPLTQQTKSIALISAESIGSSGSCPAPLSASFLGQRVEFSFDPLCTYANALRPLVIALAWLAAGFMFMGGVKNG